MAFCIDLIICRCEVAKCFKIFKNYVGEWNNSSYLFKEIPLKKENRHRTISQRLIDDNFYPVITAFSEKITLINIYIETNFSNFFLFREQKN